MYRILLIIALLLPTEAWSAVRHGYLGFFGGALMVDGLDTEKAEPLVVTLGHRFNSRVAVQLEYSEAKPFQAKVTDKDSGDEAPCEVAYSSAAAYVVLIQPAGNWLDLNLKLGYVDVDYNFSGILYEESQQRRFNSQNSSIGGGFTIKLSRHLVLTTDYTQLKDDAYHLTAGVELAL